MAQNFIPVATSERRSTRENFPVAGWFMPSTLRADVLKYYAFARLADDIADCTRLSVIQKLAALDALDSALHSPGAHAAPSLRTDPPLRIAAEAALMLHKRQIPVSVASDLLVAFRADARNTAPQTLAGLMDYCRHSASPVGRFLLALYGEPNGAAESDALCASLQILNHVQDAFADACDLKRCYIPEEWRRAEGLEMFGLNEPDPIKVRHCLNRMLDHAEHQLVIAAPLPDLLGHRALAAQARAILVLAERLLKRLRKANPWLYRIGLSHVDWIAAALSGLRVRALGP